MSNGSKYPDFLGEGFHQLDENLIEARPPKITWGLQFQRMSTDEKMSYLEKLALTMNHAAYLIQEERNKLGRLCELKEKQIISLNTALRQNSQMIQEMTTRHNEEQQGANKRIAELNAEVKRLRNADIN